MRITPLIKIYFYQTRATLLRTFLLVFGIALGVAGVVAIDIAKTSVAKSFELSTAAITSRSTHQIVGSDFTLPQEIFTQIRTGLGIQKSAPVISFHVKVREMGQTPLTLMGIDPFSEMHFRDLALQGRAGTAANDLSGLLSHGSGVLISSATARQYGLNQHDPITFLLGEHQVQAIVSGFLHSTDPSLNSVFQGLILADISLAQEILNMADHISRIDLILTDPARVNQVRQMLPPGAVLVETDQQNQVVRELSRSFEASLTAFSMLALFMGIFLIYNTVSFSITRRRGLNGTLRALGATRGQIFKTTLAEVMLYALVGSGLGIALGILLGKGAVLAVCRTVSDIYFVLTVSQTHITAPTLLKGLAAGLISSFAASFVPAAAAAHTLPITLMQRSAAESELKKYLPLFFLAGSLILGAALSLLFFFPFHPGLDFMGVFLMFAGSALVAPLVITAMAKGLLVPGHGFWAVKMALRNIVRSLSRTSVLIASLMVVTSVYIGIDLMTHSFRSSILTWIDDHIGGHIHIASADTRNRALDPGLVADIQSLSQVAAVSAYNIHRIFSKTSGEVHIFSYVTDLSQKNWSWTAVDESEVVPLLDQGWIFVSEIFAHKNQIQARPGTRVVLETLQGPVSFKIAGIFRDFFMGGGRVIISRQGMKQFWAKEEITALQLFLQDTKETGPVMDKIRSLIPDQALVRVVSGSSMKQGILKVFDNTFAITSALQILTAIVALTGILNSVTALVLERTRELGILRACGAEIGQVGRLLIWECGLSGFMAGTMALPLGVVLAWVLIHVVNRRSFGWTYELILVPQIFFQAVLLASLAALAAGIYPAVKAGRTDIPRALHMD